MRDRASVMRWMVLWCAVACHHPAAAVEVVIDYTFAPSSGSGFFSTSTTEGQQARAAVEAAADYFSEILTGTLPEVRKPDDFRSTVNPPLITTWNWEARFNNPTTGQPVALDNLVIPEDQYRIYLGARNLGGTTLGVGGPGGWSKQSSSFYTVDAEAVGAIDDAFTELLTNRSQGDGEFGRWGGVLSFDTDTNWNYNHVASPSFGENDLYSVALHEIGHAIGLGASGEWNALVAGGQYSGQNAIDAYGGSPPISGGHWGFNVQSTVYGTTTPQEAAMDPNITVGTRKEWTTLDAAGLADLGWEVAPPVIGLTGDYNDDGLVNAADYTIWRDSLDTPTVIGSYAGWSGNYGATSSAPAGSNSIPEPTGLAIFVAALAASIAGKRHHGD